MPQSVRKIAFHFVVSLQKAAPLPLANGPALFAPDENGFYCEGEEDLPIKGGAVGASGNASGRLSSSDRESLMREQSSPPLGSSAEGGSFEATDE
jgi:hypothetical protein